MLLIYTKPVCPNCDIVKSLLRNNHIEYEEIAVDEENRDRLVSLGIRSVPAIFDGDVYMGGIRELRDYLRHRGGGDKIND